MDSTGELQLNDNPNPNALTNSHALTNSNALTNTGAHRIPVQRIQGHHCLDELEYQRHVHGSNGKPAARA